MTKVFAAASLCCLVLSSTPGVTAERNPDPHVTVRDIAPELGPSFSDAGFVFNTGNPSEIILSGVGRVFETVNGGRDWQPLNLLAYGHRAGADVLRQDPTNPKVLLALTDGPYRSVDFGTTWTRLQPDFGFNFIHDFAVLATSPSVVLALTMGDDPPLWKSVDGGLTFALQPDSGLPKRIIDPQTGEYLASPRLGPLAPSRADPNVVYVVNLQDDSGYYPPGIYKSSDGGATFARLDAGPAAPGTVFPHPTQADALFVMDRSRTLYRSVNGGASFQPVSNGLPSGSFVSFVAFDAHNPSFVYIASRRGVFRSTDGGDSFQPLGLTPDQVGFGALTVAVDPSNARVIYVNTYRGNFKSVNGGVSFRSINDGWRASLINDIAFDHASNPNLYLAMDFGEGILKTGSRGHQYDVVPNSEGGASPTVMAISPTDPDLILAGSRDAGLFRTSDGGRSWTLSQVDTGLISFNPGQADIAFDPTDARNVYFGADTFPFERTGFYRSIDAGVTFQKTDPYEGDRTFSKVVVDPSRPAVIYTGGHSLNCGPLRSVDGGITFDTGPLPYSQVDDAAVDPTNANNVYLGGTFFFKLFFVTCPGMTPTEDQAPHALVRSTDGGLTYVAADAGLNGPNLQVVGLVVDPRNPARVYAWTTSGLFMSSDRAATWTLLDGDETAKAVYFDQNSIAIDPKKPNLLYLAGGSALLEVEIRH